MKRSLLMVFASMMMFGFGAQNEERNVRKIDVIDSVNEDSTCIIDSIAIDSATFVDMFMPAEKTDTVGRYTIYTENGKYGVYDARLKGTVTSAEFDELRYAQRIETEYRTNTFFNMKMGKEIGSVCINEEDNQYEIQILATFP